MRQKLITVILVLVLYGLSTPLANADPVLLDFEGLPDLEWVLDFYDGNGGPDYGITFSLGALASIDEDAGGTGNFANEPSPDTILTVTNVDSMVMNVDVGFTTGFSFFYSSSWTTATVTVYSDPDATGNVLATIDLVDNTTGSNCTGDPTGIFCNWDPIGVAFEGTAQSVSFPTGGHNPPAYDNVTLGSVIPVGVPEPATMLLIGTGLVGLVGFRRKFNA